MKNLIYKFALPVLAISFAAINADAGNGNRAPHRKATIHQASAPAKVVKQQKHAAKTVKKKHLPHSHGRRTGNR